MARLLKNAVERYVLGCDQPHVGLSSCLLIRRRPGRNSSMEGCGQFFAGADLQLVIDVTEVVLDGLRAQVEPGRGLARGRSFGKRQRDLKLLWCQLATVGVVADACGLAACLELGRGSLRPGRRAQPVERLERGPKVATRIHAAPTPAQPLAEVQVGAPALENIRRVLVERECGIVVRRV